MDSTARKYLKVALVGLVSTGVLAACSGSKSPSASQGTSSTGIVSVGGDFSQTGSLAEYDQQGLYGVELGIKAINKTGFKVAGKTYRFKLIEKDPQSTPSLAVTDARSEISSAHIDVMFGPVASPEATPTASITGAAHVIQVSPAVGASALLESHASQYPYLIAASSPPNGALGANTAAMAKFVQTKKIKTVAVLMPQDSTGPPNDAGIVEGAKSAGASVVYNVYFPPSTTDYSSYVQKVASLHPDVLVVGTNDSEMVPIVTAARQTHAARYYMGIASAAPGLKSGSTPLTSYSWINDVIGTDSPSASMKSFIASYEASVGKTPPATAVYAIGMYPWPFFLASAMQKAGSVTDTAKIAHYLRNGTLNAGSGPIRSEKIVGGQAYTPYQLCSTTASGGASCEVIAPS